MSKYRVFGGNADWNSIKKLAEEKLGQEVEWVKRDAVGRGAVVVNGNYPDYPEMATAVFTTHPVMGRTDDGHLRVLSADGTHQREEGTDPVMVLKGKKGTPPKTKIVVSVEFVFTQSEDDDEVYLQLERVQRGLLPRNVHEDDLTGVGENFAQSDRYQELLSQIGDVIDGGEVLKL